MSTTFKRGMRVLTRFGVGTIQSVGHGSAQVVVHDLGDICVHVPLEALEPVDLPPTIAVQLPPGDLPPTIPIQPRAADLQPAIPIQPTSPPPRDPSRAAMLRSMEALRFGIVPAEAISRVTVGFDQLESWVTSRLPANGKPTVSEVSGSFGTGKSHVMAAIRHVASSAGYVTASVEVDGFGVSLTDPGMLLFHLLETIEAERGLTATPMLELSQRACERGHQASYDALTAFPRVCANYDTVACLKQHGELDAYETTLDLLMTGNNDKNATEISREILSEVSTAVSRDRIRPKRLVAVGVDDRPSDFADCLLGYAQLATRAGFKGLVVTLDEFEVEYRAYGFRYVPQRVTTLMGVLADRLVSAARTGPLALFVASVGQSGEEGDTVVQELLDATGGDRRTLRKWTSSSLRQLAKRIHNLYGDAYRVTEAYDEALTARVEQTIQGSDIDDVGHVRAFVKSYVAELDCRFGPPAV